MSRFALVVAFLVAALGGASSAAAPARTASAQPAPAAQAGGGACSRATALRVGKPYFWDEFRPRPIGQVLCGPFAGPGSTAMAVTFTAPTCWPLQGWVVFRLGEDGWRPALVQRGAFVFELVAAGGEIREIAPAFRAGDSRCTPSGGKRARVWRWNGTRLAAGAWRQTEAGKPQGVMRQPEFKSPSGNIACGIGASDAVYCRTWEPPQSVTMTFDGKISICTGSRRCTGPCGPRNRPIGCTPDTSVVLAYGRRNEHTGVRCDSAESGITCTLLRNPGRGKGFKISREGIVRIG
jgi:hypothetical protein